MLTLPHHHRYDYSSLGERKDYSWPRASVWRFCATSQHRILLYRKAPAGIRPRKEPQRSALLLAHYGNMVGIWRLVRPVRAAQAACAHNIFTL